MKTTLDFRTHSSPTGLRREAPARGGRRIQARFCAAAVFALCGCGSPSIGASAAGDAAAAISVVTLERNCFGCTAGALIVLRRDGAATYTVPGNARQGTADQRARGTVAAEDFDRLARLIVSQGFFQMKESYAGPQLQDGAWASIRVVRDGSEKLVFRREDAGPANLKIVEEAIEATAAKVTFAPAR